MPSPLTSTHFKRRREIKTRLSMEEILAQPLPFLRMEFTRKINEVQASRSNQSPRAGNAKQFTRDEFNEFLDDACLIADVSDEIRNIDYALQYGKMPPGVKPDMDTPVKEFIWGAAILWLALNPRQMASWPDADPKNSSVEKSRLWQQIKKAPRVRNELTEHAFATFEALKNDQITLRWSAADWFYHHPEEKLINISLGYSLLSGLEHARSVFHHEIGHGLLSLNRAPKYIALLDELKAIKKKQTGRKNKLKPEDYKRMRMIDLEMQLRHRLWNCAEDNCVNTYSDRLGGRLQQDFGFSLNYISASLTGYGASFVHGKQAEDLPKQPASEKDQSREWSPDAQERFEKFGHLCNAVNLAFFCKNGLFADDPKGWAQLKIDPTKIGPWSKAGTPPAANDNAVSSWKTDPKSFDTLMDMCIGPQGIANLQPKPSDRLYGALHYDALVQRLSHERNEIVEKIWDIHAEDLLRPLFKEFEEKLEEQMKQQAEEQQKQQGQDQDQDGDQGDQGDEGDEGEGQEGEGQDADDQSQGKGKKGKKGKKQDKKKQKQKSDDKDAGGESGDDGQEEDGQEEDGQEDGDDPGQGDDGDDPEGKDGSKSGKGQKDQKDQKQDKKGKGKGEKTVDVDGVGEMPDVDAPGEDEGKDKDKKKDKGKNQEGGKDQKNGKDPGDPGGDGDDGDGEEADKGESVKDLMDKAKGKGDSEGEDGDEDGDDGEPSDKETKSKKPGTGDGRKPDDLTKAELHEYDKLVAELAEPIAELARLLRKLRDQQMRSKTKLGRQLGMLPEDGDIGRLNSDAHQALVIKKRTGQQIDDHDRARFRMDKQVPVWAEIDYEDWIDGSGSMTGDRMRRAMQAAIIKREAFKRVGVYGIIGLFGPETPLIIARPTDDNATIGKAIATVMKGLNSGTSLNPALVEGTRELAYGRERSGKSPLVGLTHMTIISDGDINDAARCVETLSKLFTSPYVTLDIALVGRDGTVPITKLGEIKTRYKYQEVGIIDDIQPVKITSGMISALLKRIQMSGSFVAVPRGMKKQSFRRAYHQMRPKP